MKNNVVRKNKKNGIEPKKLHKLNFCKKKLRIYAQKRLRVVCVTRRAVKTKNINGCDTIANVKMLSTCMLTSF